MEVQLGSNIVVLDRRTFAGISFALFLEDELKMQKVVRLSSLEDIDATIDHAPSLIIVSTATYNSEIDLFGDITELKKRFASAVIAVLDDKIDSEGQLRLHQLGVNGILSEFANKDVTLAATMLMLAGGYYFPRDFQPKRDHAVEFVPTDDPAESDIQVTSKERDVLSLMAEGLPNKLISNKLGLSENTIKIHVRSILRKMSVSNRTEAAILARKLNLVSR